MKIQIAVRVSEERRLQLGRHFGHRDRQRKATPEQVLRFLEDAIERAFQDLDKDRTDMI